MKTRKTNAFTLVEILIVIAIVMILAGILWLVLAPTIKAKGLETRIRSDLRQIGVAVSIYLADNDDKFPYAMNSLPPSVPRGIEGREDHGPLAPHYSGPRNYQLQYSQRDADDAERWHCTHRWNATDNPIVRASFRQRVTGADRYLNTYDPKTWKVTGTRKSKEILILCAFLDGHIAWCQDIEEWKNELMIRRVFNGQ